MKSPVGITALLTAALRAEETKRADRLFEDPFADRLTGDDGRAAVEAYRTKFGQIIPIIEVRTRFFDDALLRAQAAGARQFVFIAAGMDSRAYRFAWAPGVLLFELDQPEMIAEKAARLADAAPRCDRRPIAVNLAQDWSAALEAAGFDRTLPTTWLVEGLLQYLEPQFVEPLFGRIDALSAPGSTLLYDVIGESMLHAPQLATTKQYMSELGAPWLYGSDDPKGLVTRRGWTATDADPSVLGNAWKRWPHPPAPANIPGIPRGYFLEAHKR